MIDLTEQDGDSEEDNCFQLVVNNEPLSQSTDMQEAEIVQVKEPSKKAKEVKQEQIEDEISIDMIIDRVKAQMAQKKKAKS
jgi:hypothetical protein